MKGGKVEKIICWLFVKAHDMRDLLKISRDIFIPDFYNEIKLNPLELVPGMREKSWASVFEDMFIQVFRLFEASKGFMSEHLNTIYSNYSKSGYCPSLHDLYYYIRALKFPPVSATARYQERILTRLTLLIKGALEDMFDCSRGHVQDLIYTNTVFEILHLTSEQQIFLVNYLLSYLFYYKLFNETGVRHFIGIDDSNLIFDASLEKRSDLGLPVIHHLLTTVRKSRINIFACTQTPHQLGASIHSNSFAKIMFSLSNGDDLEFMFRSMGIKDEEQKAYCYKLKPREIAVKFSSRYQSPFIANVPEVNL